MSTREERHAESARRVREYFARPENAARLAEALEEAELTAGMVHEEEPIEWTPEERAWATERTAQLRAEFLRRKAE